MVFKVEQRLKSDGKRGKDCGQWIYMISGFAQLLGDALVVLLRHVLAEMHRRLAPPVFQLLKT